jgi:AcrR family transcriptional regulator
MNHDTKKRILDATEFLFARKGFRGTSLREITNRAGVNLAAVNYHFSSKKTLLEAVLKRRLQPVNQVRRKRLEEVKEAARKKGKRPDVKDVLFAFIEPTLLFKESEPGAREFIAFIGRSINEPDDTVRKAFHHFIKPMFQLLFETTCEALPKHPRDVIFWRLHFTLGSLFHTMNICGNRMMGLNDIKTDCSTALLIDRILPFVTAGMNAS